MIYSWEKCKSVCTPGADSAINEIFKYGGCEVRDKLLRITNLIFEKREASDFPKALTKPLYEKGDKSECGNYRH